LSAALPLLPVLSATISSTVGLESPSSQNSLKIKAEAKLTLDGYCGKYRINPLSASSYKVGTKLVLTEITSFVGTKSVHSANVSNALSGSVMDILFRALI
jgi:hypothetical protein